MAPDARDDAVELLDAGDGRRLERFGARIVDRPAPAATDSRREPAAWRSADLRFDADRGWSPEPRDVEPWLVRADGLTMELRPTSSGGLGLYPDHLANAGWLAAALEARGRATGRPPAVLHLFAHTGLLTLVAARAGAAVAHVDSARTAVAWARRNAELSGLADRPIRWLVDDAAAFIAREARRGRRYDGLVLDPPSFGRAGRRQWKLEDELPSLLAACRGVLADDAFVLLTAHTTGLDGSDLADAVRDAFGGGGSIAVERMTLEAESGARLELGWSARRAG